MKRGNLLKIVTGIAMALFVANGSYGQDVQGGADYEAISGAATEIDSVTEESTTRLYVKPDAYFHPLYTAGDGWQLTAGFTWTWNLSGAGTPQAEVNTDEYITVTWDQGTGLTNIVVTELAPAAYGGCSDDTNMYVRVIDSATVAFTAGAGFISVDTLNVCEGDAGLADIVQATLTGIRTIQLDWSLEIATLDAVGAKQEYWDLAKATLGGSQAYAVEMSGTAGTQEVVDALTFDLDRPNDGNYTAIDDGTGKKVTLYSYALNGVNDRISRKSDYLSNPTALATGWTWYDTETQSVVIRVNPAPVTGPIYHIPNDWQP